MYCYYYTVYADETTFFLNDENSIVYLSEKFKLCSDFLEIKPNTTKCETAGIGASKVVQVAVCCIKCIDLRNPKGIPIKIVGIILIQLENKKTKKI